MLKSSTAQCCCTASVDRARHPGTGTRPSSPLIDLLRDLEVLTAAICGDRLQRRTSRGGGRNGHDVDGHAPAGHADERARLGARFLALMLPSPPPTTSTTTVLRHAGRIGGDQRTASARASSIIKPTGASTVSTSLAGGEEPASRREVLASVARIVALASTASAAVSSPLTSRRAVAAGDGRPRDCPLASAHLGRRLLRRGRDLDRTFVARAPASPGSPAAS